MHSSDTRKVAITVGLLVLALLLTPCPGFLSPDSLEFISIAGSIRDGSIFDLRDNTTTPFIFYHRSPLYPFLLFLLTLVTEITPVSVFFLHLLITAIALTFLLSIVSRYVNPLLTLPMWTGAYFLMRHNGNSYINIVMSEWTALMMLFLWVSALLLFFQEPRRSALFISGALSSLLVLVRTALTFYVLTPFLLCISWKINRRAALAIALTSLFPIYFWSAVNTYRLGTPQLSPSLGYQIAVMGALVGGSPSRESDSPELRFFTDKMNSLRYPGAAREEKFYAQLGTSYQSYLDKDHSPYTINLPVLEQIRFEGGFSYLQANRIASIYGARAIQEHFSRYLRLIFFGLKNATWSFAVIGVQLALIFFCRGTLKSSPLWLTTHACFVFHLLHSLTCALIQIVIPRYYLLTLIPWLFMVYVLLLSFAFSKKEPAGEATPQ